MVIDMDYKEITNAIRIGKTVFLAREAAEAE